MTRREFVTSSAATLAASALTRDALAFSSSSAAGGGPFRVIIDTDPGVDDALALLLAMRSPELKIEAITPVAGNVPLELTLPNALRMVEIAGRTDIPVAAGAREPLMRRLVTAAYAHGENGLGGAVFPEPTSSLSQSPPRKSSDRSSQISRRVTLLPIGPLTNIATALNLDSELAHGAGNRHDGRSLSGNITPAPVQRLRGSGGSAFQSAFPSLWWFDALQDLSY